MKTVIRCLVLVALASVICSNSYAQSTITGTVRYNGDAITVYTTKSATFWARDEINNLVVSISPQYNTTDGIYSIPNMAPGTYGVSVRIDDAAPFDQRTFPGDYDGWNSPITVPAGGGPVNQDLACQKLIHLISPVDNLSEVGLAGHYPTYNQKPMIFEWQAIAQATDYQIWIYRYQSSPYQFLGTVYNGVVDNTRLTFQLADSEENQHYQFSLYARNTAGLSIGQLMVVYGNGYGWDYRFRIGDYFDTDGDGIPDTSDNCPTVYNPGQEDENENGFGDACEPPVVDTDGDGVPDAADNCPLVANANQMDTDGDGIGNACDLCPQDPLDDIDNDGVCSGAGYAYPKIGDMDNCPLVANSDQMDTDGDGLGNVCDPCPEDALNDFDGDGVCGDVDNCPSDVNPLQEDSDGDELGDACDPVAMGTEPQQPTGDVVISASTGAVFVDVTVTLKPQDLDEDNDLDDTYYVKPDPYNVVPKLFPCDGGNEIAADQVLCGPPCSLPNDLVLVTATGGPQDFTTTIELTQWFTRLAPGCYNVRAEYVNFCRDLDFGIPNACTAENPCIQGIWQGKKDLEVVKPLVLEPSKTADQCPNLTGSAGDTGCPYADKNVVMLHTVSLGKCLWRLNWEKEPLAGVSVRVFDRKNPAFLAVAGRSNPNSSLYGVIFEANQGRVGACTTDANGVCYAGEGLKGYYLAIIRFTDPETGSVVYVGRPKDPWDYDSSGIDVKHFQIMKVYKDGVFKEYRGGRMTVVEGSVLEVIEPESAVWDGNSSIYPFIFTSDSNWSVDVCAKVPAGYRIVGVYDANGNLTQSSECVQAFVNGETKTMAFEVLETGSPEPSLNATLSLKSPKGKKVKKEVRASDVRKKTFKKWLSQAKAKIKR